MDEKTRKEINEMIESFVRVNVALVWQINKLGADVKPELLREVRENIMALNNIKYGR